MPSGPRKRPHPERRAARCLLAVAALAAAAPAPVRAQDDLLLARAAEAGAVEAPPAAESPRGAAATAPAARYLGAFHVTYYWIACEDARFDGLPRLERLRDGEGRVIARVSSRFRRELDREGTGKLRDGRVLNVRERVGGVWRYTDLGRDAWGTGSTGAPLKPFASVAVDPARVPLGSRIFVPAFEGQALPGGGAHAGRFRAEDRGAAIRDARLDVFIGDVGNLAAWEALVPSHAAADVFLVADGARSGALAGDACDE